MPKLDALLDEIVTLAQRTHDAAEHAPSDSGVPPVTVREIMACVDASQSATSALDTACRIADATGASLAIAHALTHTAHSREGAAGHATRAELEGRAEGPGYLDAAVAHAHQSGHHAESVLLEGHPAEAIPEAARQRSTDLIVLGAHGMRALERWFLGSVSNAVKNRAPCSTLIVRSDAAFERILVAVDGSHESRVAAAWGAALAQAHGATLYLAHVLEVPGTTGPIGLSTADHARDVERNFRTREVDGVPVRFVARAHVKPSHAIPQIAEEHGCDPIIVGTHGLSVGRRALLGSVADQVSLHAEQSVLIAR